DRAHSRSPGGRGYPAPTGVSGFAKRLVKGTSVLDSQNIGTAWDRKKAPPKRGQWHFRLAVLPPPFQDYLHSDENEHKALLYGRDSLGVLRRSRPGLLILSSLLIGTHSRL